jgi:protein N-lysine methyltransferase METTL21D
VRQWAATRFGPAGVAGIQERDPAERELWDMMARETGIVLECVAKQAGAGGLAVEIWLGKRKGLREER